MSIPPAPLPMVNKVAKVYRVTDLPASAYAPYNGLYSKFKLHKIEWFIVPMFSRHPYNATLNVATPDYYPASTGLNNSLMPPLWIMNADNDNLLTTINNDVSGLDPFSKIRNAPASKMFSGTKPFKWTCKPKAQNEILEGTLSTAHQGVRPWLPSIDTQTQHYGTFMVADITNIHDNNPYCWTVYKRYTVYWKDPYY